MSNVLIEGIPWTDASSFNGRVNIEGIPWNLGVTAVSSVAPPPPPTGGSTNVYARAYPTPALRLFPAMNASRKFPTM